jgi:hypothetical protein
MSYWNNGKLINDNPCPECGGMLQMHFGEDNENCFSPDDTSKYTEKTCLSCGWYQKSYEGV